MPKSPSVVTNHIVYRAIIWAELHEVVDNGRLDGFAIKVSGSMESHMVADRNPGKFMTEVRMALPLVAENFRK